MSVPRNTQEYTRKVKKILETELTGKNIAVGSLALHVIEYSFGVVDLTEKEIKNMDRKTRKLNSSWPTTSQS